ncbi:dephospho-CoA kinase [Butyrivibrio sp. Su6]|uniref:dephospho-CoA kinase n=1 Tax=Butyrivibrio sp. Su6 TaxID=1520810 RepID=UPI00089E2A04|nr:dephospho-CoA kinase [Butyrivibrio sp. Su6]SEG26187.1 dephospho-CoA kinase [Butyrivibrio sp. Su6]
MALQKGKTNIIGITGGVGAGKSTLLSYIRDNYNCLVILSDDVANDIKKKGYPAYDALVEALGRGILSDDGEIDKALMAKAIFNDKNKLKTVNNILHPAVNQYIINIVDDERKRGVYDFVFVEAALLIENGYDKIVDEMWYVYADEDTRRKRLKASRGYSDQKVTDIFKSQLSDETFREHCEFVIDNSGEDSKAFSEIDNRLKLWKI